MVATICSLQDKARQLVKEHCGRERDLGQAESQWVYTTVDAGNPCTIKFAPRSQAQTIATQTSVLDYLTAHSLPGIARFAVGEDEKLAWLVIEHSNGTPLCLAAATGEDCNQLYAEAGRWLAQLHNIGCPPLALPPAKYDNNYFRQLLEQLLQSGLIDCFAYQSWQQLDAEWYLSNEKVICHGNFCSDRILVRDGKIVAITQVEEAVLGPRIGDLAAMDLYSKLTGLARYVDWFYRGYQETTTLCDRSFSKLEFYRFFKTLQLAASNADSEYVKERLRWYQVEPRFTIKKRKPAPEGSR